jgi:formate/nitrite transporter FocA (FNT family)
MSKLYGSDAYSPREIAERVENIGVAKARMPLLPLAMLGVLAGGFIGLGSLYFTLVTSDTTLGFAASRLLGGLAFSLGLVLVVVAGAELFTGNNLIAMAWAEGKVSSAEVLRNWIVVCVANFAGAAGLAVLVYFSGHLGANGGAVATQAVKIAAAKAALPAAEAFFRAVLCNILVWPSPAAVSSTRRSPSSSRSRRSSPRGSSTASPTCTSSLSRCYSCRPLRPSSRAPTWSMRPTCCAISPS